MNKDILKEYTEKKRQEEALKKQEENKIRIENFLTEFKELSKKHKIDIYARLYITNTGIQAIPDFKFLDDDKGQSEENKQNEPSKNNENK